MQANKRKWIRVMIGIGLTLGVLVLCSSSTALLNLYADYLWFESLDYTALLTRRLSAEIGLGVIGAIAASLFLLLNWSLLPFLGAEKTALHAKVRGQDVAVSTRPLRLLFSAASVFIGVIFGLALKEHWRTYLMAANGVPFDLADPIFGQNVAFYVFELPWYNVLLGWGKTLIAFTLIGALLRYAVFQQLKSQRSTAHLSLTGAAWLLLLSADRWVARYALLQSRDGVVVGASYTDIYARLPLYNISLALFAVAALILIINVFTRRWKLLSLVVAGWLVFSLVSGIYPTLVQRLRVEPNEFAVERPYIEHNIAYTRYAYGIDNIQEWDYPGEGTITEADLAANNDIVQNIRLWDYRPLLRTFGQIQEIRLYYHFEDVDVDRYTLSGEPRAVMLSARELDVDQLADQAQTWINRHLIFTHGYGATLIPVNEVSPEGQPRLLVRDIPPVSTYPELAITQPAIYFGEATHQYVIVNTTEDEFDYPQGNTNVYSRYTGPDGVPLGGVFRRLLLAMRFNSAQMLLSPALTSESRILFHRLLHERAERLMPLLWYDSDPYIVIHEGRLVWLLDAYTWTDHFPYSEVRGGLNYMRNSVKVTIDAYTGETRFYLIDPSDPIAATYARIFPDLFLPAEAMPATLRAHWRYPETLFIYQSELYATYHMEDPQVFYNREDLWAIPTEIVETSQRRMEPYYVLMCLPDSERLEFMMIRPYTPAQRQNMIAWLYAESDGADYGRLGVFKLSKDRLFYGPQQIEARIDQDPIISQQLSLWHQRGSRVLRGNLLVIPLNDTFIYVEPLYLEAESGQLPELRRVIVAYGERVVMAPTLAEALLLTLDEEIAPITPGELPEGDLATLAERAWEHYQAGQICLQAGDWECYGREQRALEAVLEAMLGMQEP